MTTPTFIKLSKSREVNLKAIEYVIYTNSGAVVHFLSGKTLELEGDDIKVLQAATEVYRLNVCVSVAA